MSFKRIMLVRPRSRCGWGFMWAPLAVNLEYIAASILDVVGEVRIVNQEFDSTPIEHHLKEFTPDIFGVTMSATDHTSGLELCRRAKKWDAGLKTIVGGYHPTAIPDVLLSDRRVDMVAVGEAELTFRELVQKGDPDGVAGVFYKDSGGKSIHNPRRPIVKDLDTLPFPARHLRTGDECNLWLKHDEDHRDQVHTSRGCWGRCTFCCEPSVSGSRQRFRKPEKVMEEIREVCKFHRNESVVAIFGDPHFMGNPKLVDRLCDLLIEADLDIVFTAMLRADVVARHPKLVEKMVKAGIIGYCMGIESPSESELTGTKKGLDNRLQSDAVRWLRRNHAVAGGTFVIGLPGQTEEEILMFPEYARYLGMTVAAFAVATPQAATEFYNDMERQGLIANRNWDLYDQMHLVFRHETLTPQRSEELLTHCIGRFYALDILLDDIIASQFRQVDGRKVTLRGAFRHFMARVNFIMQAGGEYQRGNGERMAKIFLKAMVNPHTRKRTRAIGIHNIVDLRRLLSVMGRQKFQITLRHGGEVFANYVIKTSPGLVDYIDICPRPHRDASIGITLDMEDLGMLYDTTAAKGKFAVKMLGRLLSESRFSSLARSALALVADRLFQGKSNNSPRKIALPGGFLDHFCRSDGWDPDAFRRLKAPENRQ